MFRLSIAIVLIAVLGCRSTGDLSKNAYDQYSNAANSWKGASVLEMIAAWGHPNRRFQAPESEQDGIAWWEYRAMEPSYGRGPKTRYHCSTVVHFNPNLTITNIEIRYSRNCYRLYDGLFESMTRGWKT